MNHLRPSSHTFNRLLKKAFRSNTVVMPDEKRIAMREALQEYAKWKPVRKKTTRSYWSRMALAFRRRSYRFGAGVIAIALIFVGVGATAASAHTLPGDLLYPVKVNVLEPARTALTFSDEGKASWQMTIAERRVQEAITLSDNGGLSTTTADELSARFNAAADSAAKKLASSENANTSINIISATHFSAALNGYGLVLSALPATSSPSVATLKTTIQSQLPVFTNFAHLTVAASTTVSTHTGSSTREHTDHESPTASYQLLDDLRKTANESLNSSMHALAAASSSLTATNAKVLSESLTNSIHDSTKANEYLSTHDDAHAEELFQNIISNTTQLQVLIHNAHALNLSISVGSVATSSTQTAPSHYIQNHPTNSAQVNQSLEDENKTAASSTITLPTVPVVTTPITYATSSPKQETQASSSLEEHQILQGSSTTPVATSPATTPSASPTPSKSSSLLPPIPLLPL